MIALMIMIVVEHSVDCCRFRLFPVKAGRILIVILVEMEISNDSSAAQVLALTEIAIPKVCKPYFLEGLQVVPADGEHFLMHNPVHDIGTGGIGQRPLVVVEGINLELRRLN